MEAKQFNQIDMRNDKKSSSMSNEQFIEQEWGKTLSELKDARLEIIKLKAENNHLTEDKARLVAELEKSSAAIETFIQQHKKST